MRLSSIVILLTTVAVNLMIWTGINKPRYMVESSYPLNSFSLNPYKKNQSPFDGIPFTREELDSDLKLLSQKTKTIRLYSSLAGLDQVPEIAKKYGMKVIASAFLDGRKENNNNEREVEAVIRMAQQNKNVIRVIIGNETQLQGSIPREELLRYLADARKQLKKYKVPVSTAEPWDYWIIHPELAKEVDFVAIHILPYWAEVPIDQSVDYVLGKYQLVKKTFPDKWVMIAETGWPSDGPQRGAAQASLANQAQFVRSFMSRAKELKVDYNLIEAFDQPWKSKIEGRAGEHWGIMDADRQDKFPVSGPVLEDPNWKYWALSSIMLGFLTASLFLLRRPDLKVKGQIFSVLIFQVAIALGTQLARAASDEYMSPGDIVFWSIMIAAQVLLAIILLTDAAEIADVVGHKTLKRKFKPLSGSKSFEQLPLVSLHLACCKEPPEMVIATLDSLARLDYPRFEVVVVDNNTPDPEMWRPVEAHCQRLGERFKFFSLGKWPGYKAGALNFALQKTHPEAKIIGIVDADYIVEADWLKATVPYFQDSQIAIVQAPQEHREWEDNLFRRMENDEYSGFFRIGMVQRNEHNAIIQHGTMTLIDKATLLDLHGWAEWCICEDAELGLRVLNLQKKAIYLDHPFGRGLVPSTYLAYAKQRYRWAYGAMRILKRHWKELSGLRGNLDFAQRYQFVKGWLPWLGDALHMLFTFTAIVWSAMLLLNPKHTDFPEPIFIYPALLLVVLRILGTLWTYTTRVKIGKKRTLLAMIAGGSLTHKIAKAVVQGLFTRSQPFYRTPKQESSAPLVKAISHVFEESFLALSLVGLSVGILREFGTINGQALLWAIALIVQAFPYFAAIIAALVSSYSGKKKDDKNTHATPPNLVITAPLTEKI
jgi:exo-beta-1,3-glucanase (GH17 family)/cellulose synthase/poly-beta-1,6-N-acetylglucosamine synthase-like glycosyltransferase